MGNCLLGSSGPKGTAASRLEEKIAGNDPDSNIKFTLTHFPVNDLLNSNSFIEEYPDVLDVIFYSPEICDVLERFGTASGFVCSINSLKQVNLGSWVSSAALGKSKKDDMSGMVEFLSKYVETQIFNSLLKNTGTLETEDANGAKGIFDPQEYFDEVATACAEALSKKIVPQNVSPQLFNSTVDYTIYPVSESICRNNMLEHVGILITFAGNIGVEKTGGSVFKKGKISVLIDITLKVVVFNNYIYSKRALTMVLNGIREREKRARADLLDQDIERAKNEVTTSANTSRETRVVHDKLGALANKLVGDRVNDLVGFGPTQSTGPSQGVVSAN